MSQEILVGKNFVAGSATYYLRDVLKEMGGSWNGAKQRWEYQDPDALSKAVEKCKSSLSNGISVSDNSLVGGTYLFREIIKESGGKFSDENWIFPDKVRAEKALASIQEYVKNYMFNVEAGKSLEFCKTQFEAALLETKECAKKLLEFERDTEDNGSIISLMSDAKAVLALGAKNSAAASAGASKATSKKK